MLDLIKARRLVAMSLVVSLLIAVSVAFVHSHGAPLPRFEHESDARVDSLDEPVTCYACALAAAETIGSQECAESLPSAPSHAIDTGDRVSGDSSGPRATSPRGPPALP